MDSSQDGAPPDMPARARRALPLLLWLGASLGGVVLATVLLSAWGGRGFDANYLSASLWIMGQLWWLMPALCVACAVLVLWPERRAGPPSRRAPPRLKLAATLSLLAYYHFGAFHGVAFLQYWELFHYALGSRYFPEVGYDGLYVASAEAQLRTMNFALQPKLRDLRTNEIVPAESLTDHMKQVARRFSRERRARFAKEQFALSPAIRKPEVRMDHGYNPPPTWTFVARLAAGWLPISRATLVYRALIDQALLAMMWLVLFRTYGSRIGCLAMTVFGLAFASKFFWNGGAFLRFDWLVAVVIGTCLLKRRRFAWAGAAFAFAALMRIFPAVFVFGIGVVAVRTLVRREDAQWIRQFARGALICVAIGLVAGCLVGRGARAWKEFGQNLDKHRRTVLNNNVGLENVVLHDARTYTGEMVDGSLLEPWQRWQDHMADLAERRRGLRIAAMLAALGLVALAAWRLPVDEAAALGPAVAFATLLLTCYYWCMLLLVPVRGGRWAAGALLLLNTVLWVLDARHSSHEVLYGVMSWALAVLLVAWLLPDAIRTLRREPARAAVPAA